MPARALERPHRAPRARSVALAPLAAWLLAAALSRAASPRLAQAADAVVAAALLLTFAACFAAVGERRSGPLRAAAATLSLGAFLALAELPALFGFVDYGRLLAVWTGEWAGPATSFVTDAELGWGRPPHASWSGRPRSDMAEAFNLPVRADGVQSFTTDAQGFRNPRDLSRADVALIGDSYVEGAYVSDADTVAVALERRLGRPVANLGRSGYGTQQELGVLLRYALPLQPRAVAWFFFEGNDLYDDETYENAIRYLHDHGSYAPATRLRPNLAKFHEASLSLNGLRRIRRALDPLLPVASPSFGWFRDARGARERLYFYRDSTLSFGDFESSRLASTEQTLRQGAALCRERGVALVLVFVPSKFRVYGDRCVFPPQSVCREWRLWNLEDRFAELCRRERLTLLDLTGPMRTAAAAGRVLYAPEDSHWNRQGHAFVAETLAGELQPLLSVSP